MNCPHRLLIWVENPPAYKDYLDDKMLCASCGLSFKFKKVQTDTEAGE